MPAVAPITVNDREPTPVAHTFLPQGEDKMTGIWRFTEAHPTGVPVGEKRLAISNRQAKDGSRKTRLNLTLPTLVTEVINNVNRISVDHVDYVNIEFTFSKLTSTQERKNAAGLAYGLLAAAQTIVNAMLVDQQDLY